MIDLKPDIPAQLSADVDPCDCIMALDYGLNENLYNKPGVVADTIERIEGELQ